MHSKYIIRIAELLPCLQLLILCRYIRDVVVCDCGLHWLLEWAQADSRREVIGDCRLPRGNVRLSQLSSTDLGCQGSVYKHESHANGIPYSSLLHPAIVTPEFSIHMASGVSLLCSASPQWVASTHAKFWWRKVLYLLTSGVLVQ